MISVIIPTHNRAELLPRAIESVLKQDISESIEVIVVSDGSTDNTSDVVEKYSNLNVFYYEYFPGVNGNHARNYGIRKARGEYIAFLDDDDAWKPDKLRKQLEKMRGQECGISYTGVNIIYEYEHVSYNSIPKHEGKLSQAILLDNCIGSTSTVVIRKDILDKSGVFDEQLCALQDYDLWIRICQLTKVAVISEALVDYYNYTNKVQVSSSTQKYVEAFTIIETKYSRLFEQLNSNQRNKREINKYALLLNKCLRNRNKKETSAYLAKIKEVGGNRKAIKYRIVSVLPYKYILKMRTLIKRSN